MVTGAYAASISTAQVSCNGITVSGTLNASCSINGVDAFASASFSGAAASVDVGSAGGQAVASVTSQSSDVLLVTSGPQHGFFASCLDVSGGGHGSENVTYMVPGEESFGNIGFGDTPHDHSFCGIPSVSLPYTRGVPQFFTVSFEADASIMPDVLISPEAGSASASVSLTGFVFVGPEDGPLIDVNYTFGPAAIPEPSAVSLLLCGLVILAFRRQSGGNQTFSEPTGDVLRGRRRV